MLTMIFLSGCGGGGGGTGGSSLPIQKVPNAPTNVIATAGVNQATINFAAPTFNGSEIINYTVTSSPGNISVTGTTSPIIITGLANIPYIFTVKANSSTDSSTPSQSNSITPMAATILDDNLRPLLVKNGTDNFLATKKIDGIYLSKYDQHYVLLGQVSILTDNNATLDGFFSPLGSDYVYVVSTKKKDATSIFGEVSITKVNASDLIVVSDDPISQAARIQDVKFFGNDSFFHILIDTGGYQMLEKVDFTGHMLANETLWYSEYYWFDHIEINENNIYLAGNKNKAGFGGRACVMQCYRDLKVIGESVRQTFVAGVQADTIESLTMTSSDLRIKVSYQDDPTSPIATTDYSIDFTTGTWTAL